MEITLQNVAIKCDIIDFHFTPKKWSPKIGIVVYASSIYIQKLHEAHWFTKHETEKHIVLRTSERFLYQYEEWTIKNSPASHTVEK